MKVEIKDVQLHQQPHRVGFNITSVSGRKSSDIGTQCLPRAIFNQLKNPELGIQWGSLLLWDENINGYDSFWSYHVWNTNEDDTIIYDDIKLVEHFSKHFDFKLKNDFNNLRVKVIDGTNFKSPRYKSEKSTKILKEITKAFKGKCDLIYILNYGFWNDGTTQITWDEFEETCDINEEHISKVIDDEPINHFKLNEIDIYQSQIEKREQELRKQFPNAKTIIVV